VIFKTFLGERGVGGALAQLLKSECKFTGVDCCDPWFTATFAVLNAAFN